MTAAEKMNAVVVSRFGGPEVLQYVQMNTPTPGPGEILVKNASVGIGAWDAMWREGSYPYQLPPVPFVPGQISAGQVAAIGQGVTAFAVGDSVHVINLRGGAYADYSVAAIDDSIALPSGVDLQLASCLSDYRSAWAFFQDGLRAHSARTVYMPHASGGVGMAMIQVAKYLNYAVIASAGSAEGCALLGEWGADVAINHVESDPITTINEETKGKGVDLIFDHVSGDSFAENFKMLAPQGMIFVLNRRAGNPSVNPFVTMRKNAELGWKIRFWAMHVYDRHQARRDQLVSEVLQLFVDGHLLPLKVNRQPLKNAARVHQLREAGQLLGKTLLIPSA